MKKETLITKESNKPECINMSHIWDTLIRATAKYTDRFASDLLIDYETVMRFLRAYEAGSRKSFIFGIRTNGVDHAEYVYQQAREIRYYGKIFQLDIKPSDKSNGYIQVELWETDYTYAERYENAVCEFAPV